MGLSKFRINYSQSTVRQTHCDKTWVIGGKWKSLFCPIHIEYTFHHRAPGGLFQWTVSILLELLFEFDVFYNKTINSVKIWKFQRQYFHISFLSKIIMGLDFQDASSQPSTPASVASLRSSDDSYSSSGSSRRLLSSHEKPTLVWKSHISTIDWIVLFLWGCWWKCSTLFTRWVSFKVKKLFFDTVAARTSIKFANEYLMIFGGYSFKNVYIPFYSHWFMFLLINLKFCYFFSNFKFFSFSWFCVFSR